MTKKFEPPGDDEMFYAPFAHTSAHMHTCPVILFGQTVVRMFVCSKIATIEYQIILIIV